MEPEEVGPEEAEAFEPGGALGADDPDFCWAPEEEEEDPEEVEGGVARLSGASRKVRRSSGSTSPNLK